MNETLEELEVIYKPSEDNISTNNPKAEPTCEKKITNVYIAKKKTVFVVVEAGDFLGKIAKDYMALTANDIADINRLEHPDKLKIGQEIVLSSRVYEVQSGDTLGKIAQKDEFAPVDWREIAKANELVAPYSIYVGKKLVIPLARTKQARCYKEIKYVQVTNVSVGDRVHVVTQTKGFKNNESVTNIIKEDKNIVTQPTKNLPVVENDKEKDKIVSIVEPDKKDPTKGLAVSEELEIKPKLDELIYTVKAGDSLSVIAGQYEGVTEDDIYAKNKDKLKDKNSIYVGQKLTIPTQKMEDVTTTQEVKDKLQKEPTKTTEITPTASSVSLPEEEEVEGEVVELTDCIPPWMTVAMNQAILAKGAKEYSSTLYPMVKKYHSYVGWTFKTKKSCYKTAWCASFVSWTLGQAGYKNPKTVASRFYLKSATLKKIDKAVFGAIVVFSDCSKKGKVKSSGHVSYVYGTLPKNRIACLGGNQGDRIKISNYDCTGKVFLSYKVKKYNKKTKKIYYKKHYKKCRGFYIPKDYIINEVCLNKKLKSYKSANIANKELLKVTIQSNKNGESSR